MKEIKHEGPDPISTLRRMDTREFGLCKHVPWKG